MKQTLFILSFLLLSLSSLAQEECEFTLKYSIAAASGMKMRAEPKTGTPVVTYVMADSIVEACAQSYGQATIEDTLAHWRRVRYKGKVGYMFDGFLNPLFEIEKPIISDTLISSDSISLPLDTVLPTLNSGDSALSIPAEPAFVWQRTERDSIPSTGRLDREQIRKLATALRHKDIRMDSLIGELHELPTKGSQDSVIAWIDAGMPGGIKKAETEMATTVQRTPTPSREIKKPNEPAPFTLQLATEAYNYCGNIGELNPSLNWYGLFPDEAMGNYQIKRIDLEIVVSKTRLGNQMEFDIRNSSGEVAHFLFGVNRALDTNRLYQLAPDHFFVVSPTLFPGQQMQAYAQFDRPSAANVFISATGSVIEVGACPVIENYAIKISTQGPYGEIKQDLTPLFPTLGQCGMPEMYWFGDLNGDNYPELVYVSPDKNKNVFTLFLSNVNLADGLYELGSTWTIESCN